MLIPRTFINALIKSSKSLFKQSVPLNPNQIVCSKNLLFAFKYFSILGHRQAYKFSKQKILEQLEKFNEQLQMKNSLANQSQKEKQNQFLQRQQKIVKDFLELTQQSFNQHLQNQLKEKYHVDAEILLMIICSLQDPKIVKQNIPKLYPFVGILEKPQLLLLLQLIVAHRPQNLPAIHTLAPRSLQGIQSSLLLLSQIYVKQQKIVEWLKQVPLYKGKNVFIVAAGFFAIYQKMDQHVLYKNQKLIQRCIDRIVNLAVDQDEQTQISISIMAFQSPATGHFAQQLLMQIGKTDFSEIDPLKLQLLFIHLQKHISAIYVETRNQVKKKRKYKILQESEEGQVMEKEEEEYQFNEGKPLEYSKISQIQKYKFLDSIAKTLINKIMALNWKQYLKINLLLEYWKLCESSSGSYPWNSFQTKLINFTAEKQIVKKLTNLEIDEVLMILTVMQKLKINKSQLLMKLLAILSERIDVLESYQLITLARVCVTFVRQCEDFLISLRKQIENRKFIFNEKQIQQLNEIFKRVLTLFPRPLIK